VGRREILVEEWVMRSLAHCSFLLRPIDELADKLKKTMSAIKWGRSPGVVMIRDGQIASKYCL
jgi:hypothetical protein